MLQIPLEEYQERIKKVKEEMREEALDALFVYADHYRCAYTSYFMDYRPMDCMLNAAGAIFIPLDEEPTVFVSNMNVATCKRNCWVKDIREIWKLDKTIQEVIKEKGLTIKKVGIVGDELLPVALFRLLQSGLSTAELTFTSHIVQGLMSIKSENELKLLEEAAKLADMGVEEALKAMAPGKTECEIAAVAEAAVVRKGETIEEETLVRSGERTYPPGVLGATTKKLNQGEFVTIDFHPSVGAYLGDVARTVILKDGTRKQKNALQFAHELRQLIAETIKPGVIASEVYNVIYNEVKKSEYFEHWDVAFGGGRAIVHGLGMGEENWNNIHKGAKFEIVPNMAFAIRVNFVAIESQGIHFEDALVVTESGSRLLNQAPLPLVI